jgi:hypothetical protein
MRIQALEFAGELLLNLDKTVTLQGGYGCDFTLNPGYTIISENITISTGKATLENIFIK